MKHFIALTIVAILFATLPAPQPRAAEPGHDLSRSAHDQS
jgi:hypothetical protein